MKSFTLKLLNCSLALSTFVSMSAVAARAKELPEKLPTKLPAKLERSEPKRTRIDFTKQESAVIAVPSKTISKKTDTATVVKSRALIVAPVGDSAEPLSAFDTAISKSPVVIKPNAPPAMKQEAAVAKETTVATPALAIESVVATPVARESGVETSKPLPRPAVSAVGEYHRPSRAVVPDSMRSFDRTQVEESAVAAPQAVANDVKLEKSASSKETSLSAKVESKSGFLHSIAPETISFLRAGYLNANYKRFDERMHNSATSIGLGLARGFETTWGSFEARAAFDAYHAMDQSITVDNIRMLSVRTEVAYWLSHSRVKPGLSLGLGWADYSIRSYRSVSGPNEQEVTLRTHAKSRAFTVIPATSLRVELGQGLMIDTQTEFLALLGGDNADAAQGLGVTVSLGWIF